MKDYGGVWRGKEIEAGPVLGNWIVVLRDGGSGLVENGNRERRGSATLLDCVEWNYSPNYSAKPEGAALRLRVLGPRNALR